MENPARSRRLMEFQITLPCRSRAEMLTRSKDNIETLHGNPGIPFDFLDCGAVPETDFQRGV